MLPLIARGKPGIELPLVIDGEALPFLPQTADLRPDPAGDYQAMLDGGMHEWQFRPHFDGIASHMDRYTLDVTFGSIKDESLVMMEEIRVTGGTHRVTLWRMVPMKFVCIAGLQRYYLPQRRKCAAWVYDGLQLGTSNIFVDTTIFPTYADLDGDDLAVTYAEGPTLASPGAGGIVIARNPDTTGDAIDFTAVMLGDVPVGGEVLKIWMAVSFEMSMRAPTFKLTFGQESHSHTFVEL